MNILEGIKQIDRQAMPENLHQKIMFNVRILKFRSFMFSIISALSLASILFIYRIYQNIVESGSWEAIKATFSGLDLDFTFWPNLWNGFYEILPTADIFYSFACLFSAVLIYKYINRSDHFKLFTRF